MTRTHKVKRAFLIPFIITTVLLVVLLVVSLFYGRPWEKIILAVLCVVSLFIAVEASEREFALSEDALSIRKFFRQKKFTRTEITHLGVVTLSNNAYFLVTTTRGFYIFSNLIENHESLLGDLAGKLGDEKVEAEIKTYLEAPLERTSLIVLSWVAAVIIVAIIVTKVLA